MDRALGPRSAGATGHRRRQDWRGRANASPAQSIGTCSPALCLEGNTGAEREAPARICHEFATLASSDVVEASFKPVANEADRDKIKEVAVQICKAFGYDGSVKPLPAPYRELLFAQPGAHEPGGKPFRLVWILCGLKLWGALELDSHEPVGGCDRCCSPCSKGS